MSESRFSEYLSDSRLVIDRQPLTTIQVNVGKLCNQACLHCHVEAGPKRTEQMSSEVGDRIIEVLRNSPNIKTLDITGGAPELNQNFRKFVEAASELHLEIIDRCNLTVFFEEGQKNLPEFLADYSVRVIASLPCYSKDNVEKQRGTGVFQKSIDALKALNSLGYGHPESALKLDLVYNPQGISLPPSQQQLEADYKAELASLFGITFNSLFTITNVPISRFLHQLQRDGQYQEYMDLLVSSFNPHAAQEVMCRSLLSIGWEGDFFDCDFNQMLEIPLAHKGTSVWDIECFDELASGAIAFADHCFACTAGAGSSCGGSLVVIDS